MHLSRPWGRPSPWPARLRAAGRGIAAGRRCALSQLRGSGAGGRFLQRPGGPWLVPGWRTSAPSGRPLDVAGATSEQRDGSFDGSSVALLVGAWSDLSRRLQDAGAAADSANKGPQEGEASPDGSAAVAQLRDGPAGSGSGGPDARLGGPVLDALKMALRCSARQPPRRDGRTPAERALGLAAALADLAAAGLPLDAPSIAAGIVADAVDAGLLHIRSVEAGLGPEVAGLARDMLAVRRAPERVELYDDAAAGAIRDWVLSAYDVRGAVLEVASRWVGLAHVQALPVYEQQLVALEALQVFAPLGHALGLGALAAEMEDTAFQLLFPQSYASTGAWMRSLSARSHAVLDDTRTALQAAVEADAQFAKLAAGCELRARTKSQYSVMRKLLRLDNLAAGGRRRDELWDLLGLRAIVEPRPDLPPGEAEAAATAACYRVQELAHALWAPMVGRSKDYITAPKANGYQSLHSTLWLCGDGGDPDGSWPGSGSESTLSTWEDGDQEDGSSSSSSSSQGSGGTSSPGWAATPGPSAWRGDSPSSSWQAGAGVGAAAPTPEAAALEMRVLCTLELQVRTAAMHAAAERGDAAHAGYKGGLDRRQVRRLRSWTLALQRRLAGQRQLQLPAGRAAPLAGLLPPSGELAQQQQQQQSGGAMAFLPEAASTQTRTSDSSSTAGPSNSPHSSRSRSSRSSLPLASEEGGAAAAAALFAHLDRDGDGELSLGELMALVAELDGPAAAERGAARLMAELDVDGDARVSRGEFLRFWARHGAADGAAADASPAASATSSDGTSTTTSSSSISQPPAAAATPSPRLRPWRSSKLSNRDGHSPLHRSRLASLQRRTIARADGPPPWASSSGGRGCGRSAIAALDSSSLGSSLGGAKVPVRCLAATLKTGSGSSSAKALRLAMPAGLARRPGSVACTALAPGSNGSSGFGEDVGSDTEEYYTQQQEPQQQQKAGQRLWPGEEQQQDQQQQSARADFNNSSSSSSSGSGAGPRDARSAARPLRPRPSPVPEEPPLDASLSVESEEEEAAAFSLAPAPAPLPGLALVVSGAPCEFRATGEEMDVISVPTRGPLLFTNHPGSFPYADLALDAPGWRGRDRVAVVFEVVPEATRRSSDTAETSRPGGLYVRNISRFVRGRRWQAALNINGDPLLPLAESVALEPGDVVELAGTGVRIEVALAVGPPVDVVGAAMARYVGPPMQQQQQQDGAAPAGPYGQQDVGVQQQQQVISRSADSGSWDEDDGGDGSGSAAAAAVAAGASPIEVRVASIARAARGNVAAAEAALRAVLREAPGLSSAWFVWAQIATGTRRPALARDLFRTAAAAAAAEVAAVPFAAPPPVAFAASARLAKVLRLWGTLEWDAALNGAARRLWRGAANEAFRHPRRLAEGVASIVLHTWAVSEFDRGNLRNARIVIGEALRKCSTDPAINILAGSIVARAGDVEGARALFTRAYTLSAKGKKDQQLYMAWPKLEERAGNVDRARQLFQRGIQLHPTNTKLLNVYACFEARQGNLELARQLHAHALSLDPRSATTMHNRVSWATLELDAGDMATARRLLSEGLDLHPNFTAALVVMARLERTEGRLDLAETYVRLAFKASSTFNVAAMGELRSIYLARGEEAISANLSRHLANISALQQAKTSGAAWASEAWEAYVAATKQPEQRQMASAAWQRKRELGLIRNHNDTRRSSRRNGGGGGNGLGPAAWQQRRQQRQQQQAFEARRQGGGSGGGGEVEPVPAVAQPPF